MKMEAGREDGFLESSELTPRVHVHDLLQVFDDGSENDNDLSLEEGENWLRLVDRSRMALNSALDSTQDMTPERVRLPYPVLLQLGSIDAPTDDCYICLDVDGPYVAIKDMRNPFAANGGKEVIEICLARRKTTNGETLTTAGSSNVDLQQKSNLLMATDENKTHQAQMWRTYSSLEPLPRRQLRVLHSGDRICTRLPTNGNHSEGIGLVLEYRYSDKSNRSTPNEFDPTSAIAADDQDSNDDKDDDDDEVALTQPVSDEEDVDKTETETETEYEESQILLNQPSALDDVENESNHSNNGTGRSSTLNLQGDLPKSKLNAQSRKSVAAKDNDSPFAVLRKAAEALSFIPTDAKKETAATVKNGRAPLEDAIAASKETNESSPLNIDAGVPTETAVNPTDSSRESSDEPSKLLLLLTTQPTKKDNKADSDDETTLDQNDSDEVFVNIAQSARNVVQAKHAGKENEQADSLADSLACSLNAPTQDIIFPVQPHEREERAIGDDKQVGNGELAVEHPQVSPPAIQPLKQSEATLNQEKDKAELSSVPHDVALPKNQTALLSIAKPSTPVEVTVSSEDSSKDLPSSNQDVVKNPVNHLAIKPKKQSSNKALGKDAKRRPSEAVLEHTNDAAKAPLLETGASRTISEQAKVNTSITTGADAATTEVVDTNKNEVPTVGQRRQQGSGNERDFSNEGKEQCVPDTLEEDSQKTVAMKCDLVTNQETGLNRSSHESNVSTGDLEAKRRVASEEAFKVGTKKQRNSDTIIGCKNVSGKTEGVRKSRRAASTSESMNHAAKSSDKTEAPNNDASKQAKAVKGAKRKPKKASAIINTTDVVTVASQSQPQVQRLSSSATSVTKKPSREETIDSPAPHEKNRTKRKSSPPRQPAPKRARVRSSASQSTKKEGQNQSDPVDIRVIVTNVTLTPSQKKMIERIGGVLLEDVQDASSATHVIAAEGKFETHEGDDSTFKRTSKLMIGLCCTENIVHLDWLIKSAKARKALPVNDFLLLKDRVAESKYCFNMRETLRRRKEMRMSESTLFGGWCVHICVGVANNKAPPESELRLIVEAAGGKWLPSLIGEDEVDFSHTLIITSDPETKKQLTSKAVSSALKEGAKKFPISWLFDCIMNQNVKLS